MPVTFPAHQAPVLMAKLVRPTWFDGTALVVAAAAPDLNAAFSPHDSAFRSHGVEGLILFSIPFAVIYSIVLRRWCAEGLFGALPDLGPLRIRSYQVLPQRRPPLATTIASAVLGAGLHIFIDSFTHRNRWGSDLLGLNNFLFEAIGREFTTARVFQYLGHTVGSLIGAALFMVIASSGHLERWYGAEALAAARARPFDRPAPLRLLAAVALGQVPALLWITFVASEAAIFMVGLCFTLSLLAGGFLNTRFRNVGAGR